MIFSKTMNLVLSGRKSQTMRLAYAGDYLYDDGEIRRVCETIRSGRGWVTRTRWTVGHTYAIQPERCAAAHGRFRCTYLREVLDPLAVDGAFARAEGFDSVEEYLRVWHELHGRNPRQRCWAIGMELIGKVP
jgi:hypothetical protein